MRNELKDEKKKISERENNHEREIAYPKIVAVAKDNTFRSERLCDTKVRERKVYAKEEQGSG